MTNLEESGKVRKLSEMDDQLKTLFEYTKWHIGIYVSLITALIAVLQIYGKDLSPYTRLVFLGSLLFFVLAGAAGGIVGSSIPYYQNFSEFMKSKHLPLQGWSTIDKSIEPDDTHILSGKWWTHFEHLMFWLGIGVVVVGIGLFEITRLVESSFKY